MWGESVAVTGTSQAEPAQSHGRNTGGART